MTILTFTFIAFGIVVNVSGDSIENLHFVKKASATKQTWATYKLTCPDGGAQIIVCGVGTQSTCIPVGECN